MQCICAATIQANAHIASIFYTHVIYNNVSNYLEGKVWISTQDSEHIYTNTV